MDKDHLLRCIFLVGLLAALAGCSNDTNTIIMRPPDLSTLSPSTAASGDTVVVTGSGFASDPNAMRLVISPGRFSDPVARRVAVPFGGSRTTLRAIVPDGAFAGSVRVEQTDPFEGAFAFGVQPPATASNVLPFSARLAKGSVGKSFFSGSSYDFSVTAGAASEDYLVIVFSNAAAPNDTWSYLYSITTASTTALADAASAGEAPRRAAGPGKRPSMRELIAQNMALGERDIHAHADGEIADLLRRSGGARDISRGQARGSTGEAAANRGTISGPGAAPETVQFKMLIDPNGSVLDPDNFTTVVADLKYTGEHTLLYVDVETPDFCLSDAEAQNLGQIYDESIYATDRSYFGNESDINHDGKVAILMSPTVNRMTAAGTADSEGFIAGYFLLNDLLPGLLDHRLTNGMEIFYTMVPDPTVPPQFGNYFPKDKTLPVIEGVLAHEFLHMILFNYRVLIYGHGYLADYMEKIWLDEGLAHIAEDLNGYTSSNVARANLYLADPGDVTLIYGGDNLEERGASFLFLRLLGDRFGDGIYKRLVQSRRAGPANVDAASGALFNELFADWISACYLSGREITGDARFNYSSLDLQSSFKPLYTITGTIGAQMGGSIKSMAPEYTLYTVPASSTVDFTIGAEASGRMNAAVIRVR